jgi:integrase
VIGKKQFFDDENEVPIFNNRNGAYVFNRNGYWQFRVWLTADNKYLLRSLNTQNREVAIQRGEALYLELHANLERGVKYFSVTIKEGVQKYIDYRATEVRDTPNQQGIVKGRLDTIKTHLTHFLDFVGRDTKLSDLEEGQLLSYPSWCRTTRKKASDSTIVNEMSTINACIAYLYDIEKMGSFRRFHLPKHSSKPNVDIEKVKRETLTRDEYMAFVAAMRVYVREDVSEEERYLRQLVRHYFLVAANSGMRSGELGQLCWEDVEIRKQGNKQIAKVSVRASTSKVGKFRTFIHREGQYYERWKELCSHRQGVIFSKDGSRRYPQSSLHKHFKRIMAIAEIDEARKEHLVPYSFRHFAITNRVMSGLSLHEIAAACGTSVKQVTETYWHVDEGQMQRFAKADYVTEADGTVIPTM